ncbi:hypothetical protein ENUP19_0163G0006 [Entamoeba nuttalli]|uniref:SPRY domain containing protein n=2 Tax=Entamoeba nuttalli TaxID=412467 RepID=K2HHD1_ENTNP|nr:SPRY domain containing protein [Entamoeba nuttalli P19]EKE42354.1 SPRY domain containing protein [Entamoeba nuttalli P19]|eukprot:XP_008855303.1 SPRY domain containing protein [Entamoeba nuttalli P19]
MDNQQLTQEILEMKSEIEVLKNEIKRLKEEKELEKTNNQIKEVFELSAFDEIEWNNKVKQEISNQETIESELKRYVTFNNTTNVNQFSKQKSVINSIGSKPYIELSTPFEKNKKIIPICIDKRKYQIMSTLIEYIEVKVKGKKPVISIGVVENENIDRNAHVGWNNGTVGFHSDDGKLFNENGNGVIFNEPYKASDVIGCGYIHEINCLFYTRNGMLIKIIPLSCEMNYFGIGLREYETVTINSGKTPFVFDLFKFNEELTNKTSKYFKSITLNSMLFSFVVTANIYFSIEDIKQLISKIIQAKVNQQDIKQEVPTDFFTYEEKFWNELSDTTDLQYPELSKRISFDSVKSCSLLKDIDSHNQTIVVRISSYSQYLVKRRSEMETRIYVKKPVILLYDDTTKEKEEFCCHLELNDAIDIGTTYPSPKVIKEDSDKKEYEWKGTYCSDGVSNCVIEINNKHFDYLFWEGICLKKEQFKGKEVGITKENMTNELEVLLKKLGMNEREINDFIVYWIVKLNKKYYKVTICDSTYDNEIARLKITGFNQIHRIALKFEEVESINTLPTIDSVEERQRPTGKYVIEWGAIIA